MVHVSLRLQLPDMLLLLLLVCAAVFKRYQRAADYHTHAHCLSWKQSRLASSEGKL